MHAEIRAALAANEQARTARRTAHFKQVVNRLQLRAPRSGVVVGLPDPSEFGRLWSLNGEKPFCTIGDPDRLWLLVSLPSAEYRRVRDDRDRGVATPVVMAVPGCPGQPYSCRIVRFPEAENDVVPPELTAPHGGPVEVYGDASRHALSHAAIPRRRGVLSAPAAAQPDRGSWSRSCSVAAETAASWLWETLAASVESSCSDVASPEKPGRPYIQSTRRAGSVSDRSEAPATHSSSVGRCRTRSPWALHSGRLRSRLAWLIVRSGLPGFST